MRTFLILTAAVVGVAWMGSANTAQAGGCYRGGGYYYGGPSIYRPAPSYYRPAPRYYGPGPGVYSPYGINRGYNRGFDPYYGRSGFSVQGRNFGFSYFN